VPAAAQHLPLRCLCPLHTDTLARPALAAAEERLPPSYAEERVEPTIEEHEDRMRTHRKFGPWAAVLLVTLVGLTACTYDAALRQLSPPEQAEFFSVSPPHEWVASAYLSGESQRRGADRLSPRAGVVQRFQALDPLDQEAVRSGWPRVGMSAEASCLCGEPYYTAAMPASRPTGTISGRPLGAVPLATLAGIWESRGLYLVDGKVWAGRCSAEYLR